MNDGFEIGAEANRAWDPRIDYPRGQQDDYQPDHTEWTKDVGGTSFSILSYC
jgi:hypothetical protein